MTRSDWLDRFVKGRKYLFINIWPSCCQLIIILSTIKFFLQANLAYKKVYDGRYLLGGKRQTHLVGKIPNLPQTYLPIKHFDPALLLVISIFYDESDPIHEPEVWHGEAPITLAKAGVSMTRFAPISSTARGDGQYIYGC